MRFVNLTPHTINIRYSNSELAIPASGDVARCVVHETPAAPIGPIPTIIPAYGEIESLPVEDFGDGDQPIYIVSGLVLSALRDAGSLRQDVAAPDTGSSAIRDDDGRVQAVTRLRVLPPPS